MAETIIKRLNDSPVARWTVLFIVATAMMMGYFVNDVMSPLETLLEMPIEQGGLGWSPSDYGFFSGAGSFINVFLLIIGCFLETASAITIVVPLILPLLAAYDINLTQFGIVMVLNLMIGLLTPPFGLVLFVISKIGNISIGRFSKALVPWLGALLAALLLVTFIPRLSLWFPTLLGMSV